MELSIYKESVFKKYHSKTQIARVLTEGWFQDEMYCPDCLHTDFLKNTNIVPMPILAKNQESLLKVQINTNSGKNSI